jgi:DNA-binding NarL/FixJ family response regulator
MQQEQEAHNQLVIVEPACGACFRMKKALEDDEDTDIHVVEDVQEAIQLIRQVAPSLVLLSLYTGNDLQKNFVLLSKIKDLVLAGRAKIICFSKFDQPKLVKKMEKMGVHEFISEPIVDRKALFKIQLQLRALSLQRKKEEKALELKKSKQDYAEKQGNLKAKKTSAQKAKEGPSLTLPEDIWVFGGEKPKKVGGKWMIAGYGPHPKMGEWRACGESAHGEPLWEWVEDEDSKDYGGTWIFCGQKPVKKGEKWHFVADRPDLSYFVRQEKVASKIYTDPNGLVIIVAKDSPQAQKNQDKIKEKALLKEKEESGAWHGKEEPSPSAKNENASDENGKAKSDHNSFEKDESKEEGKNSQKANKNAKKLELWTKEENPEGKVGDKQTKQDDEPESKDKRKKEEKKEDIEDHWGQEENKRGSYLDTGKKGTSGESEKGQKESQEEGEFTQNNKKTKGSSESQEAPDLWDQEKRPEGKLNDKKSEDSEALESQDKRKKEEKKEGIEDHWGQEEKKQGTLLDTDSKSSDSKKGKKKADQDETTEDEQDQKQLQNKKKKLDLWGDQKDKNQNSNKKPKKPEKSETDEPEAKEKEEDTEQKKNDLAGDSEKEKEITQEKTSEKTKNDHYQEEKRKGSLFDGDEKENKSAREEKGLLDQEKRVAEDSPSESSKREESTEKDENQKQGFIESEHSHPSKDRRKLDLWSKNEMAAKKQAKREVSKGTARESSNSDEKGHDREKNKDLKESQNKSQNESDKEGSTAEKSPKKKVSKGARKKERNPYPSFSFLVQYSNLVSKGSSAEECIDWALKFVGKHTQFPITRVWVCRDEQNCELIATEGGSEEKGVNLPLSSFIIDRAYIEMKKPYLLDQNSVQEIGVFSLVHSGQFVGFMEVRGRSGGQRRIFKNELEFLLKVAETMASAISYLINTSSAKKEDPSISKAA